MERLSQFKLCANRAKCTFVRPSVKYLGHLITTAGIAPDPDKISAISRMCPPRNVKHVLSFLQTCSWFRRFVPNFAEVSKPLSDLTKKNTKFAWDTAQQQAFLKLKELLTSSPILRQVDFTKPFTLKMDASSYALGACLLQGEGTDERPVEYASRLITPVERKAPAEIRQPLETMNGSHMPSHTHHHPDQNVRNEFPGVSEMVASMLCSDLIHTNPPRVLEKAAHVLTRVTDVQRGIITNGFTKFEEVEEFLLKVDDTYKYDSRQETGNNVNNPRRGYLNAGPSRDFGAPITGNQNNNSNQNSNVCSITSFNRDTENLLTDSDSEAEEKEMVSPTIKIRVGVQEIETLLDSGSDVCAVSERFYE
ncbi:hypothetical protein JTB14_003887 [Gonioctena quinquepunctata]|nr:hypothetical protein JTB14_003887 [Gonioctena quinquepunctata]